MRDLKILVVGGGVGGMSAAISLSRSGHSVDLIDLDPDWKVSGAGITVTGPTLRAFKALGIFDQVKHLGACTWASRFYTQEGHLIGENAARERHDEMNSTGGIMRPVLHGILSRLARETCADIRLGVSVEGVRQLGASTEVIFTDGVVARYDLVVGADGIFSKIRELLFPNAPEPKFTGQGCWRIIAERPAGMDYSEMYVGEKLKAGLNPVSETQMYMFLLEHVPDNPRLEAKDFIPRLSGLMSKFGGKIGELASQLSDESQINYRPLKTQFLASPWHSGRTLLIGDAAHATTPHLASGAGMAVEDALVLAEVIRTEATIEAAFAAYEKRRYERCRLVVETSVRIGELEMAGGSPAALQQLMSTASTALRAAI